MIFSIVRNAHCYTCLYVYVDYYCCTPDGIDLHWSTSIYAMKKFVKVIHSRKSTGKVIKMTAELQIVMLNGNQLTGCRF